MSIPVQHSTVVDLRKLVDQVPVWAAEKGMNPLAAVPEAPGRHVLLEDELVNAEAFIGLAHTCGARVLYYDSETFTAEGFVVLDENDEEDGPTAEQQLDTEAKRELKKLRRATQSCDGQITSVLMCFMAEGVAHFWGHVARWYTELTEQRDEFLQLHRVSQSDRDEDDRARTAAEVERIAAELAAGPEFRAATKRSHHQDIAANAYPPPVDGNDDQLEEHERLIRWAVNQAVTVVEVATRRVYAGYERDLDALAQEIAAARILDGATTIAARTLLVSEHLTATSGGYTPPKRFLDLLMLRPHLRKQPAARTIVNDTLPLD
ncbi:hypothetical protein [Streptomyces sp. AP-93]|uniref:hypothetical protein n=1 Tax=Streptomyces sp. AP-93 TaxID=2929048 RepID=UPI001FAF7579|nr:hypothetical protein [Streptomyces sp. AP-93]MCJ0875263.1 hypothetical protein [Streptomyces sp. AP-93]